MIISSVEIISISKVLNTALVNSKNTYTQLDGFYILFVSDDGFTGKGEVSTLKGFSTETNQEISWVFESFKLGFPINEDLEIEDFINCIAMSSQESNSLKFALDTAIYDVYCQKNNISIAHYFNEQSLNYVNLSTILINDYKRTINFDVVKLKIGVNDLDADLAIMHKINLKKKMIYRLDANQSLTLEDLISIEKKLKGFDIQYIEEPLKYLDESELLQIKSKTSFKIAIDDSMYQSEKYKEWVELGLIDFIVIKPSIFGGYLDFFNFVSYISQYNVQIVLSSSLETHIGHMATVQLASCINHLGPHGLDYYSFYNNASKHIYNRNESMINLTDIKGLGVNI